MTTREQAYQTFVFGSVVYDHKEALTASEKRIYDYTNAGYTSQAVARKMHMLTRSVETTQRVIKSKGWVFR